MREVKITILADNTAGPSSFEAEHGLSLLVEVGGGNSFWILAKGRWRCATRIGWGRI